MGIISHGNKILIIKTTRPRALCCLRVLKRNSRYETEVAGRKRISLCRFSEMWNVSRNFFDFVKFQWVFCFNRHRTVIKLNLTMHIRSQFSEKSLQSLFSNVLAYVIFR